jgi:hypothetical protein
MITREDIYTILRSSRGSTGFAEDVTNILELINTTYQPLVDAVIDQINDNWSSCSVAMQNAAKPFLPPPKLSEELDMLAEEPDKPSWMHAELHKLADKARKHEENQDD